MTETPFPELPDQRWKVLGIRPEVCVDFAPGRLRGPRNLLGAITVGQPLVVAHALEDEALQTGLLLRRGTAQEPRLVGVGVEPAVALGRTEPLVDLGEGDGLGLPPPEPLRVHGEELEEDLAVPLGVLAGGEQQPEDGRPDHDQRLAPHHLPSPVSVWL